MLSNLIDIKKQFMKILMKFEFTCYFSVLILFFLNEMCFFTIIS